jgi:hypothetical protein
MYRLRVRVYDFVHASFIFECFDLKEETKAQAKIRWIVVDELKNRSHEKYVENTELLKGGYIGDHFLPGTDACGPSVDKDTEGRLAKHQKIQVGVRKGTFGAFIANYREARKINNDDPQKFMKRGIFLGQMRVGLVDIEKLGYFNWLFCRDKWAQGLVDECCVKNLSL